MEENTDSIFQVFACTLCKKVFKTRGALRIHKQKHYSSSMKYPPAICVDSKRGIFMVVIRRSGSFSTSSCTKPQTEADPVLW